MLVHASFNVHGLPSLHATGPQLSITALQPLEIMPQFLPCAAHVVGTQHEVPLTHELPVAVQSTHEPDAPQLLFAVPITQLPAVEQQ